MKMFDDNDYDNMINTGIRVPDAIIDGRQYAEIFKTLSEFLENTDGSKYESNILWIMRCINECFETDESTGVTEFNQSKASDVVTALSYFCMTMSVAMDDAGMKEQYFQHQNETVIPQLFSECETIPYYDFSKDLKELDGEDDK